MSLEPTTNFKDSNGVDLGTKLVTKDYLISVYPSIGEQIGIPPELWVWGNGGQGRLGTNNQSNISTPVTTFSGGSNWRTFSAGFGSTYAIKTDGSLWVWGNANNGQLGNGLTTGSILTPITTFAGENNWKQVVSKGINTLAIKINGTLWTWGSNSAGRLGINSTGSRSTPVTTFAGGTNWKQVSPGRSHNAAIKTDGTLWTWGAGSYGRLGNNNTVNVSTPVTTFAGGTNWKQVSSGGYHTAAIKTDGTLWVTGRAARYLGTNDTTPDRLTPVTTFAGGTNWKQVTGGDTLLAAIKTDGTLWTWGAGYGLGNNLSPSAVLTPITTFSGGTNWKQVKITNDTIAAIKTDGTLWTWGDGNGGTLGNFSTTARSTPVTTFAGGNNWKQVDVGYGAFTHMAAIRSVDF